jgi:hypothetical protein
MPQNSTEYFMTSIHSQKVLTMLNDRLLAAYEKYYGDLQVGKMSPEVILLMLGYAVAAPNLRNYGFQTRQGLVLFIYAIA